MKVNLYQIETPIGALKKVSWSYSKVAVEQGTLISQWSQANGMNSSHDNYYCIDGIVRRESCYYPQDSNISFYSCGKFNCPRNKQQQIQKTRDWTTECSFATPEPIPFSDEEWESIKKNGYEVVEKVVNPDVKGVEKYIHSSYNSGGIGFGTKSSTIIYRNGYMHNSQLSPSSSWDDWSIIRPKTPEEIEKIETKKEISDNDL